MGKIMSKLRDARMAELQKLITKGKGQFVIVHGVLMWAIPPALLLILIEIYLSPTLVTATLSIALVASLALGFAIGLYGWSMLNKRYLKLVASESKQ